MLKSHSAAAAGTATLLSFFPDYQPKPVGIINM